MLSLNKIIHSVKIRKENIIIEFEDNENLKECPFCKGKAWLEHVEFNDNTIWYNPQCSECKAGWLENYETREEAINAWNDRKE